MSILGFRTESYSGSKVRKLSDIIEYEMSELKNKDIPQYILKEYGHYMTKKQRLDLETILKENNTGEYPFIGDGGGYGVADRDDLRKLIGAMINAASCTVCGYTCKNRTYTATKTLNYGLWLADRNEVIEHYAVGAEHDISAYPKSNVILSDLGPDGCLYGYVKQPVLAPNPLRYELVCWPEDLFLIGDQEALTVDNCAFDSARLIPQDYIEYDDAEKNVLKKAYYRIGKAYAQKVEERFKAFNMPAANLLHVVETEDIFISAALLNKLVNENEAYEIHVGIARNFLERETFENQVEVLRAGQRPKGWMHYFECSGQRGYASNYGCDTTLRDIAQGTTDALINKFPEEHEYRKVYLACKALGLPCNNITFTF